MAQHPTYFGHYELTLKAALQNYKEVWQFIKQYNLKELEGFFFQARSFMAVPMILLLRNVDDKIKINKYIAYFFYPAHIAIIMLVRIILVKAGILVF